MMNRIVVIITLILFLLNSCNNNNEQSKNIKINSLNSNFQKVDTIESKKLLKMVRRLIKKRRNAENKNEFRCTNEKLILLKQFLPEPSHANSSPEIPPVDFGESK